MRAKILNSKKCLFCCCCENLFLFWKNVKTILVKRINNLSIFLVRYTSHRHVSIFEELQTKSNLMLYVSHLIAISLKYYYYYLVFMSLLLSVSEIFERRPISTSISIPIPICQYQYIIYINWMTTNHATKIYQLQNEFDLRNIESY